MNSIEKPIMVTGLILILTGSALFAFSQVGSVEPSTRYDTIIGEIDGTYFQIHRLAFGGNVQPNNAIRDQVYDAESRFVYSHVIVEFVHQFYDTTFSETLVENILEARNLNFDLTITIYENCASVVEDCTVASRLYFPSAFIAGYHYILNERSDNIPLYDFIEIFEFGFNTFTIESPNTVEDLPFYSGTVSEDTSTDTSTRQQMFTPSKSDWKVVIMNYGREIRVHAIQFSIIAETGQTSVDNSTPSDIRIYPYRYIISDIYFEKDGLDDDTVLLVDIQNNGTPVDAFVQISFCDDSNVCKMKNELQLISSKITSLFSYAEDMGTNERMTKAEIFSLSSGQFTINYQP